jgi:hypothetical protein
MTDHRPRVTTPTHAPPEAPTPRSRRDRSYLRFRIVVTAVALGLPAATLTGVVIHARGIATLPASASARLAGMLTTRAPWPNNTALLGDRLDRLGLPPVGGVEHTHTSLAIFVRGRRVAVPVGIGLSRAAEAPLHVHATEPGVIHVESLLPFWRATLGEFFDVWGVRLSSTCLGGYCARGGSRLDVFLDGHRFRGDARTLPLSDHADIVVVFGTPEQVPGELPAYDWTGFG